MAWPLMAAFFLSAGCAMLKPPHHQADGPTLPTGVYDSKAEKWQDEALASERQAAKEKTERALKKLDRP